MRFIDGRNQLSLEYTKSVGSAGNVAQIDSALNFGKVEVGKYSLWRHLEVPNNELVVIPNYETGTATITKGSCTVTLAGASVSADFKGRYFSSSRSSVQYEIADVSGNDLTLKSEVAEDSGGGLKFSIFKKWYRLPSDIRVVLPDYEKNEMPTNIEVHGYDEYWSEYSIGNVSFTKNSKTATFTGGSALLGNVYPGDMIDAGKPLYRIRTVDSDTQITMVNKSKETFSSEFTIKSDSPYKGFLVGVSNSTEKQILRFPYIRCLYPMISDFDDTELPPDFDRCILDFAKSEIMRMNNATGWEQEFNMAQRRLQKLENDNKDLVWHAAQQFSPIIPRGLGRSEGRRFGGFR